jgi:hypothetical protein
MCATHIERDEHFELQVLEESFDCTLSWHCRDHVPFLLESSLEVSILAAEEIVEHIPCGPCRKEIYPYLDWVDRYMMYMDTPWDVGSVIISRVLGPVAYTGYRMVQEETVVCNSIQEPSLTHGGVHWSFKVFPPGRPPERVLDFIIGTEDSHGLMDVEMPWLCRIHDRKCLEWRVKSECDEQVIMIRVVQHHHGGISLRLVWDPGIAIVNRLTTDTNGIASLRGFGCCEEGLPRS